MNLFTAIFILINTILILSLPRRWAPLPLLLGACYLARGQVIDLGPLTFSGIRILIAVGFFRVIIRNERLKTPINSLDYLIFLWCAIAYLSCFFQNNIISSMIHRLGLIYDTFGIYFLIRIFSKNLSDLFFVIRMISILLVPVAIEMIYETIAVHNIFSELANAYAIPTIRGGEVRARGPFAHPILAGTVGSVCLPLMFGIWRSHRNYAIFGIISCIIMIKTCASSGPILSALISISVYIVISKYHHIMRSFKWYAIAGYLLLDLVMKDPAYYIIARSDVTGSSTGWHRARLIESAIEHINEWWLAGTEYTRHWMPTGVSWSPNHTDITNHYLQMGVWGGLPLMIVFILILFKGFTFIRDLLDKSSSFPTVSRPILFALYSSLFAQAATCISVSYFDQSFIFLYLVLAIICSLRGYYPVKFVNNKSQSKSQ